MPGTQKEENKGRRVIIYPAYFEARLSRRLGRRVPESLAIRNPKAEEIASAARSLGLEAWVEPGRYPRVWWLSDKRVVVEKAGMTKTQLIRRIAKALVEKRHRARRAI